MGSQKILLTRGGDRLLAFDDGWFSKTRIWKGWGSSLARPWVALESDSRCADRTALWTVGEGLGWGCLRGCSLFLPPASFLRGFMLDCKCNIKPQKKGWDSGLYVLLTCQPRQSDTLYEQEHQTITLKTISRRNWTKRGDLSWKYSCLQEFLCIVPLGEHLQFLEIYL